MIGFYLAFTAKRVDAGAQDNKEADVADDAGEIGFFSPLAGALALRAGGALAFPGRAVGWWIVASRHRSFSWVCSGWAFEYYAVRTAPSNTRRAPRGPDTPSGASGLLRMPHPPHSSGLPTVPPLTWLPSVRS